MRGASGPIQKTVVADSREFRSLHLAFTMRECPACLSCFDDEIGVCPLDGRTTFNSLPCEPILHQRYVLERRLGEGGMGIVYKAHHQFLKTTRAIKVIRPELVGNDPSFATRFRQEAMAAAAIGHPNIISVSDFGFIDEIPFLVMEFIDGDSLQDVMANEGAFSPEQALEYMRVIGSGVGAAHAHGIVHRDLKPLNIMIQRNSTPRNGIRILDFGLAKIRSGDLFGSFVGAKTTGIIGSPYYMAPEQWSDEEADKRCDVYSLGIILHQMLTGDVPFRGSSVPAVMKKHLMMPPPPLASARSGISEALEQAVHHALEKDPNARTATTEDLVAEIEQAVLGDGVGVGRAAVRGRVRPKAKAGASRSKDSLGGRVSKEPKKTRRTAVRTTAEQKKALVEDAVVARQTANQEDALQPPEVDGAVIAEETRAGPKHEIWLNSHAEEVSRTADSQAGRQTDNRAGGPEAEPPGIASASGAPLVELISSGHKTSEDAAQASESYPNLRRDPRGEETNAWSKAAEQARRRAAERALLESDGRIVTASAERARPAEAPISRGASLSAPLPKKKDFQLSSISKSVVIGAAALVVSAFVFYLILHFWPTPEGSASNSSEPPKAAVQREMIFIKGGMFTMGSNSGINTVQKPAHIVTVLSFYLDKTEVTNAEYAEFVKATGHAAPSNNDNDPDTKGGYWIPWNGASPPLGREQWPVGNVSARDAQDFAEWLSSRDGIKYRIPTEQEWEYAARNGSMSTLFPWGNSWVLGRANINGTASPRPVGSFPEGANPSGLQDMIGNVWEWTSTRATYYDDRKVAADAVSAHVRRGGSFAETVDGIEFSNATDRTWVKDEYYKFPSIGFRLARDTQ